MKRRISHQWPEKESREIFAMETFGENLETWWNDTSTRYVVNPAKEGDWFQIMVGAPTAALSVVTELPDYVLAGVADQRLEAPNDASLMPRTWRDIKEIAHNNVRHPIKTLLSGLRIIGDVPMDVLNKVGGFRGSTAA